MKNRTWRAALIAVLTLSVCNTGFIQSARAGVIETGVMVQTARDAHLATIHSQLAREEVRSQLARFGVEPVAIEGRLAALTDAELASLSERMQDVPAGGDGLLVVIGLTFVVLIILELVGVIDIFKRT